MTQPFFLLNVTEPNITDWVTAFGHALGPIVAAVFGYLILKITKSIEHANQRNQRLIDVRIKTWEAVSEELNEIYCYCKRVGSWKGHTPVQIIEMKRKVDRQIHTRRPFFSPSFFAAYMRFTSACFEMYVGSGLDAKIRTSWQKHKSARSDWEDRWELLFSANPSSGKEIADAYLAMQYQIAVELNVDESPPQKGRIRRFVDWCFEVDDFYAEGDKCRPHRVKRAKMR